MPELDLNIIELVIYGLLGLLSATGYTLKYVEPIRQKAKSSKEKEALLSTELTTLVRKQLVTENELQDLKSKYQEQAAQLRLALDDKTRLNALLEDRESRIAQQDELIDKVTKKQIEFEIRLDAMAKDKDQLLNDITSLRKELAGKEAQLAAAKIEAQAFKQNFDSVVMELGKKIREQPMIVEAPTPT